MKEVLKRYTGKDWSKRNESKVGASRMPPMWLAELSEVVREAVARWEIVVDWREVNSALRVRGEIKIAINQLDTTIIL